MYTQAVYDHLFKDARLKKAIQETPEIRHTPSGCVYYDLLESIVSQQLSVKASDTIFKRFLALFHDQYPHPEKLLQIPHETLRAAGLSNQKAQYLKNVATFSQEEGLESRDWQAMTDEEIITELTRIKGVGKWTVQMMLMFTLGREDVFPIDDLGIRQGMVKLYDLNMDGKPLFEKLQAIAEQWRPYRTVACRYIWKWKDV